MSRAQQIAWFTRRTDAEAFERKLHAQALANGQKCARWAEIIEAPEGFGVPVKDRVLVAVSQAERARIKAWTSPERKAIA